MRLIDADKLIEELTIKSVSKDAHIISIANAVVNFVNNQPTAYSVDEVVEELEIERKTANKTYNSFNIDVDLGRVFGLEKAIEIVKQGGVSDDVCEWKLCDEESNVYDTSCRNLHILIEGTPRENNYEFCPYCGKKIKIAGD